MSFFGKKFLFNDFACEEFELMMYDFENETQGGGSFASTVSVVEEVVGSRWKPYFYGVKFDKKLQFEIVFGVNQRRLDLEKYLDRYEIDEIASWLTGYNTYHWLEIEQEDMEYIRYRCIISDLYIVSYGNIPWALKATITCDGPYAYMYPQEFSYNINGSLEFSFLNESSHNGYYMPILEFRPRGGGNLTIENITDHNRLFSLSKIPAGATSVVINNDTGVITNSLGVNLYPNFNFKFLRLVRGYNRIKVTGNGTLIFRCEFPVNAGG